VDVCAGYIEEEELPRVKRRRFDTCWAWRPRPVYSLIWVAVSSDWNLMCIPCSTRLARSACREPLSSIASP
jgi:hypothetical protein